MQSIVYDVPSILVYCSEEIKDINEINQILWGIEEEEIPFKIKNIEDSNSKELAHLASLASKLGVGIGIDKNKNVSLTFNKLSSEKCLFSITLDESEEDLRKLGANSARLVKNIPFK